MSHPSIILENVELENSICAASATCPDLLLVEAGVHCDLLPHAHVGVPVPLEKRLQLLQLLRREVRPLPPVSLVPAAVFTVVVVAVAVRAVVAVLFLVEELTVGLNVVGALSGWRTLRGGI